MPFIKKHYEKILLSIVLLGLAVAAAALPLEVARVRTYLEDLIRGEQRSEPKPFQPVDLSTNVAVVKRLAGPIDFTLSEPHNIFNPVQWQKRPDGTLLKIPTSDRIGPPALKVTKINELNLIVSFEGVEGTAENPRYTFLIIREGETNPRKTQIVTLNTPRNAQFELLETEGPKDRPVSFKLLLKGDNDPITVTRDKPYSRIIGYSAEMKYPPHNQNFPKPFRVKDTFRLADSSESYKIVAINPNEVTVSADSTQKRTTVKLNETPPVK